MNRKLAAVITLQTLIIIFLFWMLVIYGKDEYETYAHRGDAEIESKSHVANGKWRSRCHAVHCFAATERHRQQPAQCILTPDYPFHLRHGAGDRSFNRAAHTLSRSARRRQCHPRFHKQQPTGVSTFAAIEPG